MFSAIVRAPWLSEYITGTGGLSLSSSKILKRAMTSRAAWDRGMYSASIVDNAIVLV